MRQGTLGLIHTWALAEFMNKFKNYPLSLSRCVPIVPILRWYARDHINIYTYSNKNMKRPAKWII